MSAQALEHNTTVNACLTAGCTQ